jgi:transposase
MKRYVVNLTEDEQASLQDLVKRQRVSAVKRQRAMILLKADDGLTDEEIAEDLGVGRATVERVRERCVERGVAATIERKAQENPSRPRKFDGASEAKLVQLACSLPPEGRAHWTLSLLSDRLVELKVFDSISKSSVQRALKKMNSSPGK